MWKTLIKEWMKGLKNELLNTIKCFLRILPKLGTTWVLKSA